ncbi:MAG: TonB family protein [Bryobacteraceae bacterium]|jgi:TonB family protein
MSAPLRPSSRVIPSSVEAQFANRDVYTLVIPGPNLPGYHGDWVVWFSVREPGDDLNARISAPIPVRKYLSEDEPAGTSQSVAASVQFAAVIDRNGRVTGAKILRSRAAEAIRAKALDELESWEFAPALRNGTPIEVDIAIEIPFELRSGASPAR